jgi:hypothetical protein
MIMSERSGVPSYLIYGGIFVTVFVIALGIFVFMSQSKTKDFNIEAQKYQAPSETDTPAPKASEAPADTLKLTIASPEDNSFVNTTSIKVAGATKPGTTVTVSGGSKDVVNEVNTDGAFALDIPLKEGENKLIITVFDQAGQQKTINRTVIALVEG